MREAVKAGGYVVAFVAGNVVGEYVESEFAKANNTVFHTDPVTSGRIACLVIGLPTTLAGLVGALITKKESLQFVATLVAAAGTGIAVNGISDILIYGIPPT